MAFPLSNLPNDNRPQSTARNIAFPYSIDIAGRSSEASQSEHLRQLIEQILFTSPGERVNRPNFGCELRRIVFTPERAELTAAIEAMVQGAITQWAGHLIQLLTVDIRLDGDTAIVTIRYVENLTRETRVATFRS